MAQKTFHELISHLVIGQNQTKKSEELVKIDDELKDICSNLSSDLPQDYFMLNDGYVFTTHPLCIPIHKNNVLPFHLDNERTGYIPKFFRNRVKHSLKYFDAVFLNGSFYSKDHPDIVKASDTGNYIFKKDAYKVPYSGGYLENKDNLIHLPRHDMYARKQDTVMTEDTQQLELKADCRSHKDENGKITYYFYRSMVPGSGRVVFFNETKFPKKEELNETMVGVELEYENAIELSRQVLLTPELRKMWLSIKDGSLPNADRSSSEFVSIPLRLNQLRSVEDLMRLAKKTKAKTTENCGFHVHVGNPKLNYKNLTSLVLLASALENDIFKIVPDYRKDSRFCRKLDSSFKGFIEEWSSENKTAEQFYGDSKIAEVRHQQSKWRVNDKRHYWFNIDRFWYKKDEPEKRTVEYRLHHATHDIEDFEQFILLCYYITEFALNSTRSQCKKADIDTILNSVKDYSHQIILDEFINLKIKSR